jgi:uncharacterized protein VirK/YbjX
VPLALSITAIYAAAARSHGHKQYVPFVKSIYAGTIHLIRKLFSRDFIVVLSRFHKSISDESMLATMIGHFEVVRIMNRPAARALTKRYPNYVNKYVTEYLAKSFDKKARREILKFHHQYLNEHVTESFYQQILQNRSVLWNEIFDEINYAISMSFNPQWHSEGDLSLTFDRNDIPLYEISFTIVPGDSIGCAADQALLVGRVQGRKGQAEPIRIGTKACYDIAPPHLLLAAAQSIANVLAIGVIGGVSNEQQIAKSVYHVSDYFFNYDAFWKTYLVQRESADIYIIPVPFPEKPIELINATHRRRTRLKRQLRKQIADRIGATSAKKFLKTPPGQNDGANHLRPSLPTN